MKKLLFALFTLLTLVTQAQLKVGNNPTSINASAVLEAESTTQGFLPPRMTKVQMNAIAAPAAGLIVYCTDCNPASHYSFDGTSWNVLGSATNPNATFTSNTLSCSGTLAGSYVQYTAMNSSNTKTLTITCNTAGTVTGSTNAVNGVTFSVNTTLYSTGANTPVTLTAAGTPQASGTFAYTATVAGQTCSFNVTYSAAATFNCGAITHTLPASLVNGTAYNTGSVSLPYTAGTGAAYPTATVTSNGLTLTRVVGTYAAGGGTVVYNISGTYTGTTGGNAVFTLPDGGCTVAAGAAGFSGSPSCGTPVGNYVSTVAMTGSNTVPITITASGPGAYTVTSTSANGVVFGGSGNITSTGTQTITLTASGTPTTSGAFSYTITIGGQSCTFTVIYKPSGDFAVGGYFGASYSVSSGTDVSWTHQLVNNNGVTISGTGITLKAGRTYRLTATVLANSGWFSYQFVNSSNTLLPGTNIAQSASYNANNTISPTISAEGIYTVGATDETIKVRIKNAGSTTYIAADANIVPSVVVEEIASGLSYAVATKTSSTSTLTGSTDVSWESQLTSSGGVTISGSSITLLAGKTYRLSAFVPVGNSGGITFSFVNSSNTTLAGTVGGYALSSNAVNTHSDFMPAGGFYTVGASNETVKVRTTVYSGNPVMYVDANLQPQVVVQEMPSIADYGAAKITAQTGALSSGNDISWSSQVANKNVTISGADITLKAGKTYRLQAILGGNQGYVSYRFVNAASGAVLAGTKAGISQSPNWNPGGSTCIPAEGVYTVGATDETIRLRVNNTGAISGQNITVYANATGIESGLIIKEIK